MLRSYIAFDVETTGLNPQENEIIEIGALKVRDGRVAERFMEFIKPSAPLAPRHHKPHRDHGRDALRRPAKVQRHCGFS